MLSFIVPLSGAKLQLVQNFACRIVLGLRNYDHITGGRNSLADGLGRLGLSVSDKLLLNDIAMIHKCHNGKAPQYLSSMFVTRNSISQRTTRSSKDLNLAKCGLI